SAPALRLDLGRDCVVEPVLDNPKPFIELVLDVPREGVQSLPGRDEHQLVRGAGVWRTRATPGLARAVSSSRCSTTRNPSSSWCSTFPGEGVQSLPGRDEHQLV